MCMLRCKSYSFCSYKLVVTYMNVGTLGNYLNCIDPQFSKEWEEFEIIEWIDDGQLSL